MSNKNPAKLALAAVFIIAIATFAIISACKASAKKQVSSKVQSSSNITLETSSANLTTSTANTFSHINVELFHPILQAVNATFFEDLKNYDKSHKITGSFDFDGDGKKEDFSVNYPQTDNTNAATEIVLGKAKVYEHLLGMAGVYALKLNEKSPESLLCLVEYNTDNYIYSHFYSYKNGKITSLGKVDGSFKLDKSRQPLSNEYNEQILVDGAGRLIPRYALLKYLSPNIILNMAKYTGDNITKISLDPNAFLSEEYTVAIDTKPFFEEGNYNSASYSPKCSDKDKLLIKKGEKLKLINISSKAANQEAALVRFDSGKQGLLYFYLNP